MKNNFDNLRHHNEKLTYDLQQMRVKDLDVKNLFKKKFFKVFNLE